MPFDPLAWGCGFVLNQLSARLLKPLSSDQLRKRIQKEAEDWAKALPPDVAVDYQYVFGETLAEPEPQTRPARFRLQEILQNGVVPSEAQWLNAFIEHWRVKRAELGADGNAFFQQSEDAAQEHLLALARRVHRCCQADPELARRTITIQLGEVLRGQEEERLFRERQALLPYYARDLTPDTQQLFLERPKAWEFRLFSAVLADEIALHASVLYDYEAGLSWGPRTPLESPAALTTWLKTHLSEAQQFGANLSALMNDGLPVAFGPPGEPGDGQAIIDIARKVGDVHRRGIEWVLAIRRVSADPHFQRVLQLSERLLEDMVRQIRVFSETLASSLQAVLADEPNAAKRIELTLTLTVPPGAVEELSEELESLTARLSSQ